MKNNCEQSVVNPIEEINNSIKVGIAITPEEKQEIYRFRYQIYIEEMSKNLQDADYKNKMIYDELDDWAFLLYARIGSELIATARINIGTVSMFPEELVKLLSIDKFQDSPLQKGVDQNFSYCAKLMVSPMHRSSPALYLLIAKCYELSEQHQVQFVFLLCSFHLLRLYEQIGFHRYTKNLFYPGYGLGNPIVFVLDDAQHLRKVRSPLFRLARKRKITSHETINWFHQTFIESSNFINSQLIEEEELWSILTNRLNNSPLKAIALLHSLTEMEAKKFLHACSSYVQCEAGDIITVQGDISYSYDILLKGGLSSLTHQNPSRKYASPGQHFGVNGLTEHNKHIEDIIATDPTEILILSGTSFQKFFHSAPNIAHKIVYNTTKLAREKLRSPRS